MCMTLLRRISFYTCLLILTGSIPGFAADLAKEVFDELNRVRQKKPVDLADELEAKVKAEKRNPTQAETDAINFFRERTGPLRPFDRPKGMDLGAEDHVKDIGPKGFVQHDSSFVLAITDVKQADKGTFTATGMVPQDQKPFLAKGFTFTVRGSNGHDGTYAVESSEFGASNSLVVKEPIRKPYTPFVIKRVGQDKHTFTVAGNETGIFKAGRTFTVKGSTGNDRTYTVESSTLDHHKDTSIVVKEQILNPEADGKILGNIVITFADRVKRYGTPKGVGAENLSFGQTTAQQIVMAWILSSEHRKNIFTPSYCVAGVACGAHMSKFKTMCVSVFYEGYADDPARQKGR